MLPSKPNTLTDRAYENVCYCRHTDNSSKTAYLNAVSAATSEPEAEMVHRTIRSAELRGGGIPNDLEPDEGLGVLVSLVHFIRYTAKEFSMSAADFEKEVMLWLAFYANRSKSIKPSEQERLSTFAFLRAKVPCRADGEIWLFRNPERTTDVYHNLDLADLENRLGLPPGRGGSRLTFSFRAAGVSGLAAPRFYDVQWPDLDIWDWRGFTRPYNGLGVGLEELVAEPPSLAQLAGAVRCL